MQDKQTCTKTDMCTLNLLTTLGVLMAEQDIVLHYGWAEAAGTIGCSDLNGSAKKGLASCKEASLCAPMNLVCSQGMEQVIILVQFLFRK